MLKGYPKVFNLGHKVIQDIFRDPVLMEEKVDGSQFSFRLLAGDMEQAEWKVECRSHHKDIDPDAPDSMFREAVETVKNIAPMLRLGWTYRGEYLKSPKHNTLAYDRIPKGHIVIFDIDRGDEDYLNYEEKRAEVERIGLECVPQLGYGTVGDLADLKTLLDKTSFLGGQKVEGVVFKNYARICPLTGQVLMGKFVSEEFKEVHAGDWKDRFPAGKEIKEKLIEELRTPARWDKAILHLREQGLLENDPRDIGALLKEINKDVLEECKELVRDRLFTWAWKDIARGIIRGFPEYYKEKLAASAIEGSDQ